MRIQQFLDHHGIGSNPFAEEDAQTDPVFKDHCIGSTYHPAWDKIYGNPAQPSTAIVFGEKGSGKTALRLQMAEHLKRYNRDHPLDGVLVIEYDDFNPFLDRFRNKLPPRRRRPERLLREWKLWDHMDAILSLGVTRLVDRILKTRSTDDAEQDDRPLDLESLDRMQARDLLLLAACYDQSLAEPFRLRWRRLRRRLRFRSWRSMWQFPLGVVVTLMALWLFVAYGGWAMLIGPWPYLVMTGGWLPWLWRWWQCFWRARGIARQVRVLHREIGPLRGVLMQLSTDEVSGQPLPTKDRTDDRYELLTKFQGVVRSLGYAGVIVLVDRVDEPHVINGSAQRMRDLVWPMLDNKLLKHPGIGFKLMLLIELEPFIEHEDRDFYQRARLDKQNLVPSLEWTGEALYDVANARLRACAVNGRSPTLRDLFDDTVTDRRLIDSFRDLRVPRHLFKFLYRLFVAHSNAHTDDDPVWKIPNERFESVLAVYRREQDAFERGVGAG